GGRLLMTWPAQPPMPERRALLAGVVGTLLAGGVASLAGRGGGLVASSLPLATAPTRQPATPVAAARAATAAPLAATPGSVAAAATPVPAVDAAVPTEEPLPNPPAPRRIARDQDGSLTAAGRPKGELA